MVVWAEDISVRQLFNEGELQERATVLLRIPRRDIQLLRSSEVGPEVFCKRRVGAHCSS